jgi:hypothetical protein
MNKEQQRIAIAEAVGWRYCGSDSATKFYLPPGVSDTSERTGLLPDFPGDLNAMAEAFETVMDKQLEGEFATELYMICRSDHPDKDVCMLGATAAQRAEAFLKCLGLWVEEPTTSTAT